MCVRNMENICIYIKLPPYLAQWFVHEQGGETPVHLRRGSVESLILEHSLRKQPRNLTPELDHTGKVAIVIPSFPRKSPLYYNHLPLPAQMELRNCIRNRFIIAMWRALHRFEQVGEQQKEAIYNWMNEQHIEDTETNWNAIAKLYQRKRNIYRTEMQRRGYVHRKKYAAR